MDSYWVKTTKTTKYLGINENLQTDVGIIGGGITGTAIAYMLRNSGLSVTILEADRIGLGVTASTTAKITSQHGLIYDYLYKSFNIDTLKSYLYSNEEAIKTIENIVNSEDIDCDFVKQDSYVYTCDKNNDSKILDEVEALKLADFKCEYTRSSPLPFDIISAIKFTNQAQFHPRKYILSLLPVLEKNNVKIFEQSKVMDIEHKKDRYELLVNNCKVSCKYLVVASHYPIKNFPGMYFIKMYQDSSYAIGIEMDEVFDGMYISCDEPITSFRNFYQGNGKKLLIVVGSSHKTGATDIKIEDSYINLEKYIKSIYPKAKIKYRWMTEDCISLDKIPYIGDFSNFLPNMYVATGYKKWGMTTSHVAAKIITDKILGINNPYEEIYTATRIKPIKNSKEFGNILKQSAYSLAINKLSESIINYEELKNDSGGVVNYKGKKLGVYKDKEGNTFAVLPYCKHLGCELSWNNLEKTWDCPCHGSRYDYKGNIITEPTTEKLDIVEI